MDPATLQSIGLLIIIVGLLGALLPLIPGPPIVWVGALVWSIGDGYKHVGWPLLVLLAVLAAAAWGSDLFLTTALTRRAGVSWKAIIGAIVGGLLGGLLLSGLAIFGAVSGVFIGALLGVLLMEYLDKRKLGAAVRATLFYLVSTILSNLLEIILSLAMVGLFVWRAFFS